ncbi:MAG: glycosyltransferase [Phycisphaerae bacterium]|jgi:glycosyltransferase involved in cell wall biosynthesis
MDLYLRGLVFEPSGYATTTRNIFRHLYKKGINVKLENMSRLRVPQFAYDRDLVDLIIEQSKSPEMGECPVLTCWLPDMFSNPADRYSIGLTMLESDRITPDWVRFCNAIDEVWVPSKFNYYTFMRSGVDVGKINIVPLGINDDIFNIDVPQLNLNMEDKFILFSNFEWSERKNPKALIEGYYKAFDYQEDVVLIIRTYNFGRPQILQEIAETINSIKENFKKPPEIMLLMEPIPPEMLASLYKASDLYITMTHGEGWNLPANEAMACGTPVVAPNWSAHLDFMTLEDSYFVKIKDFEEVPMLGIANDKFYKGSKWAVPDVDDFVDILRNCYNNREELKQKGQKAALRAQEFTWNHTAINIINNMKRIIYDRPKYKLVSFPLNTKPKVVQIVPSLGKRCGIAEYTVNLANSLDPEINLGVFDSPILPPEIMRDVNILHFQIEYGLWNPITFKRCFYAFPDKKRIATIHSIEPRLYDFNRAVLDNFDLVIVHSKEMKEAFIKSDKVKVMPMGIKNYDYKNKDIEKIKTIASFGLMFPQKGFIELAVAMKQLEYFGYNWLLLSSIQEGNETSEIAASRFKRIIETLELKNLTWVDDYIEETEIVRMLHEEADLIVLPYAEFRNQKGISAAAKTCVASCTPMITTDISFFADSKKALFKIPNNLPEVIINSVLNFKNYKHYSEELQIWTNENCWERVGAKYDNLYEDMMSLFEWRYF